MRRTVVCAALALAGCGGAGEDGTLTVYLEQRLGPDGPPGQIAPVLMPVERERRTTMSAARQAVLAVRQGPGPGEWGEGFVPTLQPETRVRGVRVVRQTATVDLTGREPDVSAAAAVVYSLTELPGVERVALRLDGRPCCVRTHGGVPVETLTRRSFRGWRGEPCALRGRPDDVRCSGG